MAVVLLLLLVVVVTAQLSSAFFVSVSSSSSSAFGGAQLVESAPCCQPEAPTCAGGNLSMKVKSTKGKGKGQLLGRVGRAMRSHVREKEYRNANKVLVSNVHFKTTKEELEEVMESVGGVTQIKFVKDSFSGKPKGIAFVVYNQAYASQVAIEELDETVIHGRAIRVRQAYKAGDSKRPQSVKDAEAAARLASLEAAHEEAAAAAAAAAVSPTAAAGVAAEDGAGAAETETGGGGGNFLSDDAASDAVAAPVVTMAGGEAAAE